MTRSIEYRREGGFDVYAWRDDPVPRALVKMCIDEGINHDRIRNRPDPNAPIPLCRDGLEATLTPLSYYNRKRLVLRLDAGGRSYVLKKVNMGAVGWQRLLPWFPGLSYYTRVMRIVGAAVEKGCRVTQDVYVVAERWRWLCRHEVWVMLQYIESTRVASVEDSEQLPKLFACVRKLLEYGVTMDDLSRHNFLLNGDEIYAIDVSCRFPTWLERAKMVVKLRYRFGIDIPARNGADRFWKTILRARYWLKKAVRGKV